MPFFGKRVSIVTIALIVLTEIFVGGFAKGESLTDVRTLHVVEHPTSTAVIEKTGKVYVGSELKHSLSVIDSYTGVVKTIENVTAEYIAVDQTQEKVYVASYYSNAVTVIDGRNDNVVAQIRINEPTGLVIDNTTQTLYVAALKKIFMIDTVTDTPLKRSITVPFFKSWGIETLAIDEKHKKIYAGSWMEIMIIDIPTKRSTKMDVTGYGWVQEVAVDPKTHTVFVSFHTNKLVFIDAANATVTNVFDMTIDGYDVSWANGAYMLAVDNNLRKMYVTYRGTRWTDTELLFQGAVAVFDISTKTLTDTLKLGKNPCGLAVNDDTHEVFVTDEMLNIISVISMDNTAPLKTETTSQ